MNSKKAKRLRGLVKHLMAQGAIAEMGMVAYNPNVRVDVKEGTRKVGKTTETFTTTTLTTAPAGTIFGGTVRLDAACGRAIYNQMKKRAHSHRAS